MAKIYKVNQLPYDDLVTNESAIYYNYNTREIILKTTRGVEKFQAMVPPKSFDAFSVNGYFPLYFSAAEAELHSPVYESISYGEEELGPPPPNVTYPVFMPLGLTEFYDGDYTDPIEDDNDNGVLNFRDPQEVGIVALPVLDYARQDPFTTPTGTILSVNDYISKADVGTYNDTDEPVAVCTPFPAVIFDGAGDVSYIDGPGAGVIPSGGVLFKDIHQPSTVLTEPSAAYTADPFVSFGGVSVNISEYLPNGFSSILENTTGSSYSIYVIKSGIIVSSVGEVTYFLPGQLTLNHGDTVFYSQSSSSSLEPTETIYVDDNFVYDSCDIELKDYLDKDPIDGGSYNHMTSDVSVITHTDGVIINPATCSVTNTQAGIVTLPPGNFLITKISKVLLRFIACTAGSAISVQWFEEDADGALVLRTEAFDSSNPAIQYWEFEGDDLVPREFAYSSTTESAQYFELDDSGNVVPVEGDGSTTGSGSSGGGSSGGGTGGGTTDISYNVSLNQSIVFGSISNVSPTAALVGETVSFDVSAETNFQIDTVTATQDSNSNPVSLSNNGGGNYSFSMPADNVTLNATFVAQDTDGDGISDLDDPNINDYNYTVSIDSSTNGSLSVDNSTPIFGTTITITAAPSSGYETSTITVTEGGGAAVPVSGTGNTRTFIMPATNVTVSGTFTASGPSSYTVSVDSGLSNGSLSTDESSATEGSTITITASPDTGYETSTITVTEDGGGTVAVSGTGDSRTFTMPATNVTVSGTFTAASYTVSVDSLPSNGSFSVDKSSATEGSTVTITASPDSGYETLTVTVEDEELNSIAVSGTGDTRTFTMPATNVTVSGGFASITPIITPNFITSAIDTSFFRQSDGDVYAAGRNRYAIVVGSSVSLRYGILGTNQTSDIQEATPKAVVKFGNNPMTGIKKIVSGQNHVLAIDESNKVWGWGNNFNTQIHYSGSEEMPYAVECYIWENDQGSNVECTDVAAGDGFSIFLKTNGEIHSAGDDSNGSLGLGTITNGYSRGSVNLENVIAIDAGRSHTLFLKSDGTVWSCGWNGSGGALSHGNINQSDGTPSQCLDYNNNPLTDIIQISAGEHFSMFLKSDGTVWAAGLNTYGQLGDSTAVNRPRAVQSKLASGDPLNNVTEISAGRDHALVKGSDFVLGTGSNTYFQIGYENTSSSGTYSLGYTPVLLSSAGDTITNPTSIHASQRRSFVSTVQNTVHAFGTNNYGQLGNNSTVQSAEPTLVNIDLSQ